MIDNENKLKQKIVEKENIIRSKNHEISNNNKMQDENKLLNKKYQDIIISNNELIEDLENELKAQISNKENEEK